MSTLLDALIAAEEYPPLKGDRGPKGDTGDKGDKGDTGYQGLEGPTGPMGPDGPKGDPGPEGPIGKDGKRGPKGDKGDKGDEGPAGKDGAAMGIAGGRSSYNVRGFASGMVIDDEGTKLNSGAVVGEIDFVGSGVSAALVGSKAVVTVTGGSGLPSGGTVGQVVTNTAPGAGTWQDPSSGFPDASGSGPPTTDPTTVDPGYVYLDTTSGGLYIVVDAIGTNEWALVGGEISGAITIPGVILGNGTAFVGKSISGIQLIITDVAAYNDSGNGIRWSGTGAGDGHQFFSIKVGAVGVPKYFTVQADGTVQIEGDLDLSNFSGNIYSGNTLPTADPLVAGQWWNSLGVLMVSAG